MCMPTNHGSAAVIPPADFFAATQAVQRLPPTRPPYQRHRAEPRQLRPVEQPSLTSTSSTSTSEDDDDDDEKFDDATDRVLQSTAYCTCKEFHTARALRNAEKEKQRAITPEDMMMTARLFIVVSIAILATKIIADTVFPTGVASFEVDGHDRMQFKCNIKRQLPPIEQGNTVIDSIFQIPINTLSAVGTLIKNVRPLVRRTRERLQQYYGTAPRQHKEISQNNYSNDPEYYPIGRHSRQVQAKPEEYRIVYLKTPTKSNIKVVEYGKAPFNFE